MSPMPDASWERLEYHIRETLKTLNESVDELKETANKLQQATAQMNTSLTYVQEDTRELKMKVEEHGREIAVLKFKSGLWGALAGVITAALAILIQKIK